MPSCHEPRFHLATLVFPALLHRLAHALRVFLAVLLVQIRRFHVGWRRRVGIVEQTTSIVSLRAPMSEGGLQCKLASECLSRWLQHRTWATIDSAGYPSTAPQFRIHWDGTSG
jgi:hypothetical protein